MAAGAPREWRVCPSCLPLPGDEVVCTTNSSPAAGTGAPLVSLTMHRAACECLALRREVAAGAWPLARTLARAVAAERAPGDPGRGRAAAIAGPAPRYAMSTGRVLLEVREGVLTVLQKYMLLFIKIHQKAINLEGYHQFRSFQVSICMVDK